MLHSRKNRQTQRGFTLVELLVVISIIGVLMSLLLPAVNSARAVARNTECRNNVKNVSSALLQYEAAKKKYPGYRGNQMRNKDFNDATWFIMILPYLEAANEYERWQTVTSSPAGDTVLVTTTMIPRMENDGFYKKVAICPDDLPDRPNNAFLSYVINSGIPDTTPDTTNEKRGDGLCHNFNKTKFFHTGDTVTDGKSQTLMVAENNQARFYNDRDQKWNSFMWNSAIVTDDTPLINKINGIGTNYKPYPPTEGATNDEGRPSSYHSGGVNVAFADGSLAFLREDLEYNVYQHLMTPSTVESTIQTTPLLNPTRVLGDGEFRQ